MAYVISDACISCGACEGTCPAGAISEGDGQYVIDADTCMGGQRNSAYGVQCFR